MRKLVAILLAVVFSVGMLTTVSSAADTQSNGVYSSKIYAYSGGGYTALENASIKDTAEAVALRQKFDKIYKNKLVGLYLKDAVERIAVKPASGVSLKAFAYFPDNNTKSELQHVDTDAKGYYIFELKGSAPYSVVLYDGELEKGSKLVVDPNAPAIAPSTERPYNPYLDRSNDSQRRLRDMFDSDEDYEEFMDWYRNRDDYYYGYYDRYGDYYDYYGDYYENLYDHYYDRYRF